MSRFQKFVKRSNLLRFTRCIQACSLACTNCRPEVSVWKLRNSWVRLIGRNANNEITWCLDARKQSIGQWRTASCLRKKCCLPTEKPSFCRHRLTHKETGYGEIVCKCHGRWLDQNLCMFRNFERYTLNLSPVRVERLLSNSSTLCKSSVHCFSNEFLQVFASNIGASSCPRRISCTVSRVGHIQEVVDSVAGLAELLLRSPRKLFIFINKKYVSELKSPRKK